MAKLVIQNQGMTGRVCELHTDRTTIGRVEDNTFQIADPSVSSHHCEVHLRGSDIFIRDLNSTNGSFINGNEKSLKAHTASQERYHSSKPAECIVVAHRLMQTNMLERR